jgi:hypothetical protein
MSKGSCGERRAAVRRNVVRSFEHLASHEEDPHKSLLPRFEVGPPVRCIQQDWFGFYAMRVAARSVLQSINFLSAAALSAENDLNAPAVATHMLDRFCSCTLIWLLRVECIVRAPRTPATQHR